MMKMSRIQVLALRVAGLVAIVAAFIVFSQFDIGPYALAVVVTGIIALVAPDVVDQLPFGPNKPGG